MAEGRTHDVLGAWSRAGCSTLPDAIDHLAIRETVAQPWPRCGGERIDGADAWAFAGFDDPTVVAWLEAGVPTAAAATRLSLAGLEPREVLRECLDGMTLGLAFARGLVSMKAVLGRRRAEDV